MGGRGREGVDGDGVPDVVVGAPAADGVRAGSGSAFVVFGHGLAGAVDLSALGPGGFRIDGATQNGFAAESVALADDVNGDGLAEVAVGGFDAYVVFGRAGSEPVDLAKLGSAGYRIEAGVGTGSPRVVAAAGDVNGDGVGDLVLGAPQARSRGRDGSGAAYVVFGKTGSSAIELENLGPAGFRIDGPAPARAAGGSCACA
jgi:FG-GAP repeat